MIPLRLFFKHFKFWSHNTKNSLFGALTDLREIVMAMEIASDSKTISNLVLVSYYTRKLTTEFFRFIYFMSRNH